MFTEADIQFVKAAFPTIEFRHNVRGRRMYGADLAQSVEVYVQQMVDSRFVCGHVSAGGHILGYGTCMRVAVWDVLGRMHPSEV